MKEEGLTVYWVIFKYRLMNPVKNGSWKPRYRWRTDTILVQCHNPFDVHGIVLDHVKAQGDGMGYEIEIVEKSKVCLKGGATDAGKITGFSS